MSEVFFTDLGIRRPDHFLGAGSGAHTVQTCGVMTAFESHAAELAPDVVVVVGAVLPASCSHIAKSIWPNPRCFS